ncbi:redoxin domain-containing protein [Bacteroidales bacterium OttesenSCG-928-K22]|nr:redoxin domain-containing protein [Bacteroidales bacterium OttesenSCG-928-K22]
MADSATVKNNQFIFTDEKRFSSGMYHVVNQNKNRLFDILIEDEYDNFDIIVDYKNLLSSLSVKKSKINSDYFDYLRYISLKQNEINPYINQLRQTEGNAKEQIKKEIELINSQVYTYIENLIIQNQNNILGLILKANLPVKYPKTYDSTKSEEEAYSNILDIFFQNFMVDDVRLLRTPIYQEKINEYLDKLTVQDTKHIIISVDKLLDRAINSEEILKYLLWHVTAKYEELLASYVSYETVFVHIIDKYYVTGIDTWTSKSIVDALINRANEMRATLIGEKVPDIKLLDKNKKPSSLYSIDAPFTLIYFWTDDCSNCKNVTEELLKVYQDYNDRYGLEIFGVYAGTTFDKMLEYIKSNNITWTNTYLHSNQEFDYIYLFDIHSTPYLILLDTEKKVITKKFSPLDLESVIKWNTTN